MVNFSYFKIDYDSPLKHISYLDFKDYIIDVEEPSEPSNYLEIRKIVDQNNIDTVKQKFTKTFHKKENYQKMINFLLYGFPRCYLDSKMFDIQILSKAKFHDLKKNFKSNANSSDNIIGVLTNYIGFENIDVKNLVNKEKIGCYYFTQGFNDIYKIKILKKLYINWENFDCPFYMFRKENFIDKTGPDVKLCNKFENELSYYLEFWLKSYLKTELYFLSYLINEKKQTQKGKPNILNNNAILIFETKQQKKKINDLILNFSDRHMFQLLETKFYWKRSHLTKYDSWVSYGEYGDEFEDDSLFEEQTFKKAFTLKDNPFISKENIISSLKKKFNIEELKEEEYCWKEQSNVLQDVTNKQQILFKNKSLEGNFFNKLDGEETFNKENDNYNDSISLKTKKSIDNLKSPEFILEIDLKEKIASFNAYKNCEILIENLYKSNKKDSQIFFKQNVLINEKAATFRKQCLNIQDTSNNLTISNIFSNEKKGEIKHNSDSLCINNFDTFWELMCGYLLNCLEEMELEFCCNPLYFQQAFSVLTTKDSNFQNKYLVEDFNDSGVNFDFSTVRKHENDLLVNISDESDLIKKINNIKDKVNNYWNYIK